jgi:hypothetical protein
MPAAVAWYSALLGLDPGAATHEDRIDDLAAVGEVGVALDAHQPASTTDGSTTLRRAAHCSSRRSRGPRAVGRGATWRIRPSPGRVRRSSERGRELGRSDDLRSDLDIPEIPERMRDEVTTAHLATRVMSLDVGPKGYRMFTEKEDGCVCAVFRPGG